MNKRLRLPDYLKTSIASLDNNDYKFVRKILSDHKLNTVCQEARCPNKCECFSSHTATFMILGKSCTRNCAFCNVENTGCYETNPVEPINIAKVVNELKLKYCVITSVTRDDLTDNNDYGSIHYLETISAVKKLNPDVKIEVLTPDFKGNTIALDRIVEAKPDVFNHNIETIKRLYPVARQMADFEQSIRVLEYMKNAGFIIKTGFMVGLGENLDEIKSLILKLNSIGLDILTVGQYIQPSKKHLNVEKYYTLDEFKEINDFILSNTSIKPVVSPLARSSYKAFETYLRVIG